MKSSIPAFLLFVLTHFGFAQDFKAEFDRYCEEGDTVKQKEVLSRWEKADPKNAELFTSYFNYYFQRSRQEFVSMTTEQPEGESLSLKDSTGHIAGYLGSEIHYNEERLQKGLDKIDQGITMYPDRLDMRFGKIYSLGQVGDWERFTEEIIKAIRYSATNKNDWTWANNEPKPHGKEFFLSALQTYQLNLYNTGDDNLLVNMRQIANEILKIHPSHIESLSNVSITYLLTGEYDNALEALLRAEKIDGKDPIVLSNIAQGYKLKGDKKKAIEYYQKTIKYGDERAAEYAKQQIEQLKK